MNRHRTIFWLPVVGMALARIGGAGFGDFTVYPEPRLGDAGWKPRPC